MKPVKNILLIVLAFSLISGVSAGERSKNQSPESIVTCQILGPGIYRVAGLSLPASINAETCTLSFSDITVSCASCISSLEDQGCNHLMWLQGKVTRFLT